MIITTKSLKFLATTDILSQGGLGASTRPLAYLLTVAVTLMVYGNAQLMTAEQVAERPGSASSLRFDGTDDRVTVPYDASFPTEVFTASAWIKLAQPTGRAAIIARGEDDNSFNLSWQLYVTQAGALEVMLEDSNEQNYCYPLNNCAPMGTCTVTGNMFVADDAWHHVTVTRDATGVLALYIDGEKRAGCEGTGVPSSNNFQDLSIGCTFGSIGPPPDGVEPPIWFFSGLIDEPAMWNVALSDMQIEDVFSVGIDPLSTELVGYWPFDEGMGQVVADLSQAENDGFLGETPEVDSADPLWEVAPVSAGDSPELKPETFRLEQNHPNPFNPITTLRYDLPENSLVNITIYDMLGRQIKTLVNQTQDAGYRSVIWDATNDYGKAVSAGIYLYQIQAGEYLQTKKMVLLK